MARTKKAPVPFNTSGKFAHLVGKKVKMTGSNTETIGVYLGEKPMCGVACHTVRESCRLDSGQPYTVDHSIGDWSTYPVTITEVKL